MNNSPSVSLTYFTSNPLWRFLLLVLIPTEGVLEPCEQHVSVSTIECSVRKDVDRFRSVDGTCNNRKFPLWGAADTPMFRLLSPEYEDGREAPIGFFGSVFYDGYKLPNARDVTRVVMAANYTLINPYHTAMLAHWGQIIAHDMTRADEGGRGQAVNCSSASGSGSRRDPQNCFNIPLSTGQDRRLRRGVDAMPLIRSESCASRSGKREQLNTVTAFLDGSTIYGSDESVALRVRDFSRRRRVGGGRSGRDKDDMSYLLRENEVYRSSSGKPYLPFDAEEGTGRFSDCFRDRSVTGVKCFLSGDKRTNEQLMLLVIHTLLHREHNRIAKVLRRLNPHWDGEEVFQETKKLVVAIVQRISYGEWFTKIVGAKGLQLLEPYAGYREFENPSTANSFGTAVMRFGHTIMVPVLERRDRHYAAWPGGHVPLRDGFFAPEILLFDGGVDPLIRGSIFSAAKEITGRSFVTTELTEHLFPHALKFPQDLSSRNIQRAREHGVPAFNEFRRFCGLPPITTWTQFENEIRDPAAAKDVEALYKSPENVDLWVGGLHERPLSGSKLGPTFTCLLVDQFKRTRDGDRFWYEREGLFTPQQVSSINNYTLSKLICHNADTIRRIQPDAFEQHRILIPCASIPDLDLNLWRNTAPPPVLQRPEFGKRDAPTEYLETKTDCVGGQSKCVCRYATGKWTPCDTINGAPALQTRTDTLVLDDGSKLGIGGLVSCAPLRTVTRKCRVSDRDRSQRRRLSTRNEFHDQRFRRRLQGILLQSKLR